MNAAASSWCTSTKRTRSALRRSPSLIPLMPSPGRPNIVSTPQSASREINTSAAIVSMPPCLPVTLRANIALSKYLGQDRRSAPVCLRMAAQAAIRRHDQLRLVADASAVDERVGRRDALAVDGAVGLDRAGYLAREDDVRHPGVDAAGLRVGVDAERLGGGVGRLADDVVGSLVGEDRVHDLGLVDDRRDAARLDAAALVVESGTRQRDDEVVRAVSLERAALRRL